MILCVQFQLGISQSLKWAKALGGINYDQGSSIVVDAAGNILTTGSFSGTVDFDPGPGIFNLTSVGLSDVFIYKLDVDGNFVWAKAIGGVGYNAGRSIAVDTAGNVFTIGYFQDTADFDSGPGTFNLTSAGGFDIFISKLDTDELLCWD